MHFHTFSTAIVSSVYIAGAIAAAAVVPGAHSALQAVDLSKQSGCESFGPLDTKSNTHYIIRPCQAGSSCRCQVMDASGCISGDTERIQAIEVTDPDYTHQYAFITHSNSVYFTCPPIGQVRCQAAFNSANDSSSFSLRVI